MRCKASHKCGKTIIYNEYMVSIINIINSLTFSLKTILLMPEKLIHDLSNL